jgi:hypothetical protein
MHCAGLQEEPLNDWMCAYCLADHNPSEGQPSGNDEVDLLALVDDNDDDDVPSVVMVAAAEDVVIDNDDPVKDIDNEDGENDDIDGDDVGAFINEVEGVTYT